MSESLKSDRRWYPEYPMVAVHALILRDGRILLARRSKEPSKGKWSLPGGRVELGETLHEAAAREILEECSVTVEIERILDVSDMIMRDESDRVKYHFVLVYLLARYAGGEVKAQSDAEECRWVTPGELAGLDVHPQLRAVLERTIELW